MIPAYFLPIFGSIPALSRAILARCVKKTNSVNTALRKKICPAPKTTHQIEESAAATNAASEEIRAAAAVTSHVAQAASPTGHAKASKSPYGVRHEICDP